MPGGIEQARQHKQRCCHEVHQTPSGTGCWL
jgi:hypothetical protein